MSATKTIGAAAPQQQNQRPKGSGAAVSAKTKKGPTHRPVFHCPFASTPSGVTVWPAALPADRTAGILQLLAFHLAQARGDLITATGSGALGKRRRADTDQDVPDEDALARALRADGGSLAAALPAGLHIGVNAVTKAMERGK